MADIIKQQDSRQKQKARYEGYALVHKPSNEFFILFRASKEEVESIAEKIIPIRGTLKIVRVIVSEL